MLLPGNLTVIPAHADFSAFSPTYLAVFLVARSPFPVLIYLAGRPRAGQRSVPVWDGGIVTFKPRMQYSAMTFSAPDPGHLRRPLPAVGPRCSRASRRPGRAAPARSTTRRRSPPCSSGTCTGLSSAAWNGWPISVRPLQSGDVNLYLLYVFAVILLAYLLGAV